MTKHMLSTERITGEFKYLYASASGINQTPKRLWFTTNIDEKKDYISYDVEVNGKTIPFTEQQSAIEYYNKY